MNALIASITSMVTKKKSRSVVIDSWTFRLHYRWTCIFLIASAMLISSKQLFGDPIKCSISSTNKLPGELLDTFCWTHTTFSINTAWNLVVGKDVVYPGIANSQNREHVVHHTYYQWVALVLFIQALFFYLPHLIWKSMYGRKITDLVPEEFRCGLVDDVAKKDAKTTQLAETLVRQMGRNDLIPFVYLSTEFLNLLNILVQVYLTNIFLGGNFLEYGLSVLHHSDWGFSSHYDPMLRIFPRMTKCTFYSHGDSGDVSKDDALCILPVNVINEKIYLLLWFWMALLLLLTTINAFLQSALVMLTPLTTRYLRSRCTPRSVQIIKGFTQVFSSGDLFILTAIRRNMDTVDFEQLLAEMYSKINVRPAPLFTIDRTLTKSQEDRLNLQSTPCSRHPSGTIRF